MLKTVSHAEAQSFEILKFKSFLKIPSNPPEVSGIYDP